MALGNPNYELCPMCGNATLNDFGQCTNPDCNYEEI